MYFCELMLNPNSGDVTLIKRDVPHSNLAPRPRQRHGMLNTSRINETAPVSLISVGDLSEFSQCGERAKWHALWRRRTAAELRPLRRRCVYLRSVATVAEGAAAAEVTGCLGSQKTLRDGSDDYKTFIVTTGRLEMC